MVRKHIDKETPVRKACLNRLDQWQRWGYVIDYDDVSDLGKRCHRGRWTMKTIPGKRDIIAIIQQLDKAWIYLIECKAPDGGVWSKEQQDYAKRFCWLNNVVYEVVKDPGQIDKTLEEITGRTVKLLSEI